MHRNVITNNILINKYNAKVIAILIDFKLITNINNMYCNLTT
jgi:hypothetical protein